MKSSSILIADTFLQILRGMCNRPKELEAVVDFKKGENALLDRGTCHIRLQPHMADFSIICGKGGRQIRAFRTLVAVAGKRLDVNTQVDLEESYRGEKEIREFKADPNFDEQRCLALLDNALAVVFENPPSYEVKHDEGKLKVYFERRPERPGDVEVITALADLFYPFGRRQGRVTELHMAPETP